MEMKDLILGISIFAILSVSSLLMYSELHTSDGYQTYCDSADCNFTNNITQMTSTVVERTENISTQVSDYGGWFSGGIETIKLSIDMIPMMKNIGAGLVSWILVPFEIPSGIITMISLLVGAIVSIMICWAIVKAVFK